MRFCSSWIFFLLSLSLIGALQANQVFFYESYTTFLKAYTKDGRVHYAKIAKNKKQLQELVSLLNDIPIENLSQDELKAFWINTYNIFAIHTVIKNYPIYSPKQVSGFFSSIQHPLAGLKVTLDEIEHEKILKHFKDARIHFAIVCASRGCPKIRSTPYRGSSVDKDIRTQTMLVLNDPFFVDLNLKTKELKLSELFRWYKNDFTRKSDDLITFINQFRKQKIPSDAVIQWTTYDWTLNDTVINSKRDKYFDSSALRNKGGFEIKSYNVLYTQSQIFDASFQRTTDSKRSSWFTSITGFYYGIHEQWNLGLDFFGRSVLFDSEFGSPANIFKFERNQPQAHSALTSITPKVKFAPIKSLPYLSMQASLLIPLGTNFEGNNDPTHPFLDWDAWQLWYEIYYDLYVGDSFSFFFAVGIFPRVGWMGSSSIPIGIGGYLKSFFQYFLNEVFTFYLVGEVFGIILNGGIGTKILFDRIIQLDISVIHSLIGRNQGVGTTYNLGVSYSH